MSTRQVKQNFSANLQHLCHFYSSASEVCRKIGINRQQFNRYLHGECLPSFSNMKKICDFFGVESEEITIDNHDFCKKISPVKADDSEDATAKLVRRLHPVITNHGESLQRFVGYYYRYFISHGYPGHIYRSFNHIYQEDGVTYLKHIERVRKTDVSLGGGSSIKYDGVVIMMANRIFIVETEPFLNATVSETILAPNNRPSEHYISGLQLYASACSNHYPVAARVIFEFLGKNINVREAMRKCRLVHHEEDDIPLSIREAIKNTISPSDMLLHPAKL